MTRDTTTRSARLLACAGALTIAAGAAACGGKDKKNPEQLISDDAAGKVVPKVDPTLCETKGKEVATFDLDQDQRPDVWKLYKTVQEGETTLKVLSCKQVDLDHDGRKDYVVAYSNKGGTVFEKFDFDFDGRFDAFYQFDEKTAKVIEVQRDSDFDGRYDLKENYDDAGSIESIKRDRNADGKPDVWEQFDRGELVAILYDEDFDSKVDRREEIKLPKPPPKDAGAEASPGAVAPSEGDGADGDKPDGDTPDGDKPAGDKPDGA